MALSGLGDLAGKEAGEALAFGLGFALARVLEPAAAGLAQEAWSAAPIRAPDAGTMAEAAAQHKVDAGKAAGWAAEHGYGGEAFDALVAAATMGPALGQAFEAWRRSELDDGQFETALERLGIAAEWHAALKALRDHPLDPAEIAKAIHRGIMRGAGLLVAVPPETAGKVPAVPPSTLDPVTEAAWSGITEERLRILVGNAGLPPGIVQMLQLLNRDRITVDDFLRGVGESNMRNEWGDALLELRRHLLTPHEYAELALRGWLTTEEMHAGAALSGLEPADADLLFKMLGRPLAVRQIVTALARGGQYGGDYEGVPEPFNKALRESNVRPEWGNLAYHNRYTLPGAFVLRSMAQAGELSRDETEQLLLESGWPPDLAAKVSSRWAASSAGAGKQETKAELEAEYAGGYITETEYRAALELLGFTGHVQDLLVHLGDARRVASWREKAVAAIGKAEIGASFDPVKATAALAEIEVTGQAAELLVDLWGRESKALQLA